VLFITENQHLRPAVIQLTPLVSLALMAVLASQPPTYPQSSITFHGAQEKIM